MGFVLLVLLAGVSACTDRPMSAPVVSAQQECERSGGIWRSSTGACERSSGGGGY